MDAGSTAYTLKVVLQGATLLRHMWQNDACYMLYNSLLVAGHRCVSALTGPVGRRFYGVQPKMAAMRSSTGAVHEADWRMLHAV